MRQKTKAKILTAYFFGICFLAFSNLSCSGDVETNTTNLGNGDVSGITMRVNESNGIGLDNLNTFIYGRKHITEDNKIMTVFARTHQYFQPTKESKVDELTEGPDGTIKFNHKNGDENKVTIYSIDLNKIII